MRVILGFLFLVLTCSSGVISVLLVGNIVYYSDVQVGQAQ